MMLATWKRVVYFALTVVLLIVSFYVAMFIYHTVQRLHAYTTQAHMAELSGFLREYQPRIVDPASFLAFLRQHDKIVYFRDGWGHPVVVETWNDNASGPYHYRIISLGRSGKRSSCCKAVGQNWDLNSVIENGKWVQVWDF
jgi:hypothetical protein